MEKNKSFVIKSSVHEKVKDYCDKHGLKIQLFVERILEKAINDLEKK